MRSIFSFNKKHFNIDGLVLTSGKNITFIICTIVSAFFNLFFISNIGGGGWLGIGNFILKNAYLLILISIGLEMSKLYHVTLANTTAEILRKLDSTEYKKPSKDPVTKELGPSSYDRLEKVHKRTKNVYKAYAALAIMASLFTSFYIMISLRTDSVKAESQIQAIYSSFDTIEKLENQIIELENSKNEEAVFANIYSEFITPRKNIINKFDSMSAEEKEEKGYKYWYELPEYKSYTTSAGLTFDGYQQMFKEIIGSSNASQIIGAVSRKDSRITEYFFKSTDKEINRIQLKLDNEKESVKKVCNTLGETFNNKKDLDIYLADLQAKREQESGTTGVFVWVSNTLFGGYVNSSTIMAVFLFILSCLIELTIYQTSPKAKISRRIMYEFKQYLPKDFDINSFMNEVEKELIDYEVIKRTHNEERELDVAAMNLVKAETKAKIKKAKNEERETKAKKVDLNKVQKILDRDSELDELINKAKEAINE